MLREFSAPPSIIAAALIAALLILPLAACGIKGPLKLPPAPVSPPADSAGAPATPASAPEKERAP